MNAISFEMEPKIVTNIADQFSPVGMAGMIGGQDVLDLGQGLIALCDDAILTFSIDEFDLPHPHAIGIFQVDPGTQQILHVDFIWEAPNEPDGRPDIGVVGVGGQNLGFFVLTDGFAANDFDGLPPGRFAFAEVSGGRLSVVHLSHDATQVHNLIGHVALSTQPTAMTGYLHPMGNSVDIGFGSIWASNGAGQQQIAFNVDLGRNTANALRQKAGELSAGITQADGVQIADETHTIDWTLEDGSWRFGDSGQLSDQQYLGVGAGPARWFQPKGDNILVYGDNIVGSPTDANKPNAQKDNFIL